MSMVSRLSWAQGFCDVVGGNRGRRATMVTPAGREAREDEGTIRLCFLVYLRRCGDGPLRREGWYSMATHPSDS